MGKIQLCWNKHGHFMGADKAEDLLNWIHDLRIKITTLYVLSNENLERKDEELDNIYKVLHIKLEKLYKDSRIHKRKMKIKAIGNVNLLPRSLQDILIKLEKVTAEYNSMFSISLLLMGDKKNLLTL